MSATRVPIIFGAAAFGAPNTNTVRIPEVSEAQTAVDIFVSHGHKAFDTSRFYSNGTSEEVLGRLDLHGSAVDTKVFAFHPGFYAPESLRASFEQSRKALGQQKIRIVYLHKPDRSDKSAPFEDVLREVNEWYTAGKIEQFGLSNFFSWEVAEFVTLGKVNGWTQPTVYQGCYNAIERTAEIELLPCLRKYGIKFFAYSPLAGGLLVGKALGDDNINYQPGSRWDPKSFASKWLHGSYDPLLPVFRELKTALELHNINLSEAAQRWLQHHSVLGSDDAVLIGISSVSQLEPNLKDCEGGPLPGDIVKLLDDAWIKAKPQVPYYAQTA